MNAKRFWTNTDVAALEQGFAIHLDGRPIRTPAKAPMLIPSRALADAIAAEWQAQDGQIDPDTMPLTKYLNTAIDGVSQNREAVIDEVAGYGGSDLLCYRAGHPAPLVERQEAAWGPYLDWLAEAHDVRLVLVVGVIHTEQPPNALAVLRERVATHDDIALAGLHDLTALSGSLVLALAVSEGHAGADAVWKASRVDEEWQAEQWGPDDLAIEAAAKKERDFLAATNLLALLRV